MSDRTQIGPAVDSKLWERFRQDVKARKGSVRGNLGNELDKALREYLNDSPSPTERRIDERLARLEEAAGLTPADGGTLPEDVETHTRAGPDTPQSPAANTPDSKPSANASTDKKLAWLSEQLIQQEVPNTRDLQSVSKNAISDLVVDAYGFRSDTARRYVDMLQQEFGLVPHPNTDKVLLTEEKRDEMLQSQEEDDDE